MTAWGFILLMLIAFAVIWVVFARRPGPRAKIGPDGTNVREPESFVVHHEGKGQGIDISNTALKERTEEFRRDLPGDDHKVKAPIPGRSMTQMDSPPSDISKYGNVKVAPGQSPSSVGRRITDAHRDVELASDLDPSPNTRRTVSPATTRHEPEEGQLPDATLCEEGIVAMVRNPRSLYAYWGETGPNEAGHNAYHCLKVSDLTTGRSYLVPVSADNDHWFINEGIEPGHQYVVSHGWQIPSGEFSERAASDPVETPPGLPSPASLNSAFVGHPTHGSPGR